MSRGGEPGYRRQRTIYTIRYDEYPGLWVRAKNASTAMYIELSNMEINSRDRKAIVDLADKFIDHVLEWNLEDEDGTPIEPTRENLLAEEFDFMQDLVSGWMRAMAGVAAPLENSSSGGEKATEESIPMEPLSTNQAS